MSIVAHEKHSMLEGMNLDTVAAIKHVSAGISQFATIV